MYVLSAVFYFLTFFRNAIYGLKYTYRNREFDDNYFNVGVAANNGVSASSISFVNKNYSFAETSVNCQQKMADWHCFK